MNKLLICVTSFNRLPYTQLCLSALENLENITFDCIISDNNSKQEVKDWLKQYDGKKLPNGSTFKVLFLDKNYGVGKALNKALALKQTDQHFMKLDNDTILPSIEVPGKITKEDINKNCLFEMVDCLENSIEPVSCIGALLFDRNRSTKAPAKIIETTTGNTYLTEDFTTSHINGACQLYKNTVINSLCRFSEKFIYGYEDSTMARSANKFGLGLAAEWLLIKHIDDLQLPDALEILNIKKESLARRMQVPSD